MAWAVIDKDGEFWDAAPLSSKESADKRAAVLNRTRDGYPTPYTVVPLYAHPAATAREEAWKAMVEACERIYDSASRLSRSARPCRDGHRVDSGVLGEVESDIDDLRAALTLARSVKDKEV